MKKVLCILISLFLIVVSSITPVYANGKGNSWKQNDSIESLREQFKKYHKDKEKRKEILKKILELKKQEKEESKDADNDEDKDDKENVKTLIIFVNGEEVTFKTAPVAMRGKILVPADELAKMVGAEATVNSQTHAVTIVKENKTISVIPGSKIVKVNNASIRLDYPARYVNGKTMVPLSFIKKVLYGEIEEDGNTVIVVIEEDMKVNLALGKTVVASSSEGSAAAPEYAVDGKATTRWSSAYSDPQWIYVDLGSVKKVSGVKLNWESAYGKSYKIQISNDAANWVDVYSTANGDGGLDTISFNAVNARYVRMYGSQKATQWGYSLWEFEVYAKGDSSTPAPTPTPTPTPTPDPTPTPTPLPSERYEAEVATLSGGASISRNHTGYSGSGFVNGYWNVGSCTTFAVNVSKAGSYDVLLRYANASGSDKTLSLYVNGVKIKQTVLPQLSNWDTWGNKSEVITLFAGANMIQYMYDTGDTGNANIDYIAARLISGALTGSLAAAPDKVTLSGSDITDWVHWGYCNASGYNRKSGITQQISNFSAVGSGTIAWMADNPVSYSWAGGTPVASVSSVTSAPCISGIGNGFQISVPADTTQKTLKLYVGAWKAKGKIEATLSDGSAAYTAYVESPDGVTAKVLTLDFKAISAGHTLTIKYTLDSNYQNNYGNITLQAATLK